VSFVGGSERRKIERLESADVDHDVDCTGACFTLDGRPCHSEYGNNNKRKRK
jgi:hypothetical protein